MEGQPGKLQTTKTTCCLTLRCRHNRLTPNSLRLGSTIKGYRVGISLEKTQNQILNEAVRQVHYITEALNKEADNLLQILKSHLSDAVSEKVTDLIENTTISTPKAGKDRHGNSKTSSFPRTTDLEAKDNSTLDEIHNRLVKNLLDRDLTQPDQTRRGLNMVELCHHTTAFTNRITDISQQ